jgi:RNA polymerase sigma-70 factor, ECF subfamily
MASRAAPARGSPPPPAGLGLLDAALRQDRAGPYQLQASIAACHAGAANAADTDGARIAQLYHRTGLTSPFP